VNVFTRSLTDNLASLVKEIDSFVGKNKSQQAAAFVVLLSSDPDADEAKLKEFAKKHNIKNVPLTLFDGETGPPSYKVAKDADLTVLLWRERDVKANHALKKGELNESAVEKIMADTPKILK
jgi:hypothetical protein